MTLKAENSKSGDVRLKLGVVAGYILKYGVPLIITVGLCYLLFTGVDLHEMLRIIRTECNFWWIAAAIVVSILSHVVRALRWRIQLRALGVKPSVWILVLSIFGTYAVNLVLPRLGELWRSGYIAQRQKASFTEVFGSMVAERLADTVTVALLTAATFLIAGTQMGSYLQQNPEMWATLKSIISSPWLIAGCVTGVIIVFFVFRYFPDNALVRRVKGFVKGLWQGFAVIAVMPGKGLWLFYTVALWGCYFSQLYLAFFSFGLTTDVVRTYGIAAVLVCFVLSSISMGVPSNGGIGPWQWAVMFGLSMFPVAGLTRDYSLAFANLVMGSQTLLLIVLGIVTFVSIAIDKRKKRIVK